MSRGDFANWKLITRDSPPSGAIVKTKIDDENGVRNVTNLVRQGGVWFLPDWSMYVYYQPTHWSLPEPPK